MADKLRVLISIPVGSELSEHAEEVRRTIEEALKKSIIFQGPQLPDYEIFILNGDDGDLAVLRKLGYNVTE